MSAEVLQVVANAVNARLIGASRTTRLLISELLSYEVDGADRTASFKAGNWDGRDSFYDFASDTFPAGFVHQIGQVLTGAGHQIQFAIKQAPAPLGPDVGTHDPLGYGFAERYDYQLETVRRLLRHKRMVAQIATGGGKSNVAVLATSTIARPTLFLTTRGQLMHQMAAAYTKAGMPPGVLGDGVWALRKGVNVGMVQTIDARLAKPSSNDSPAKQAAQLKRREQMIKILSYFELVIGEEAHEIGGSAYYNIMKHCTNAHYRLALTGTPFMRPDGEANMRLQAAFGSIGIQVSEKKLIDRGILATPYFKMVRPGAPHFLRRATGWPTCYDIGIVESQERNKAIAYEVTRGAAEHLSCLTLVQREKHGDTLHRMLGEAGVRSAFIFGKHEQSLRTEALNDLKAGNIDTVIGSTIMDVGVDVPAVGMVVIAGGGKAEVGHRQRIGRGLREKKRGANIAFILDFMDDGNKHLYAHSRAREAIIRETPGFAENLLGDGQDYPYDLIRAARA